MTKEQLERQADAQRDIIAALGSEIEALFDIFKAAGESPRDPAYIVGYVGGIGEPERGNVPLLLRHAAALRKTKPEPKPEPAGEPNPAHHRTGGEPGCRATTDNRDLGYICTAQDGHDGPDHVAYKPFGGEYHRWPVAEQQPEPSGMQSPAPVVRIAEPACPFIREYDGQIYPCVLEDDHADEHQDRLAARWWHGDDDSQTVTHAAPRAAGQ